MATSLATIRPNGVCPFSGCIRGEHGTLIPGDPPIPASSLLIGAEPLEEPANTSRTVRYQGCGVMSWGQGERTVSCMVTGSCGCSRARFQIGQDAYPG